MVFTKLVHWFLFYSNDRSKTIEAKSHGRNWAFEKKMINYCWDTKLRLTKQWLTKKNKSRTSKRKNDYLSGSALYPGYFKDNPSRDQMVILQDSAKKMVILQDTCKFVPVELSSYWLSFMPHVSFWPKIYLRISCVFFKKNKTFE